MTTFRALTFRLIAASAAAISAAASATVSSVPSASNALIDSIEPRFDWAAVPKELQALKLDVLVMRSGANLIDACDELLDAAYELRNQRPARPGPHAVLWLCDAGGNATPAQGELQEARALLEKMRGPPGVWRGETFYATEGPSDMLVSLYDRDGEVIAETFEIGEGGATVFDRAWWRDSRGKVERMRFDISSNAVTLARYLGTRVAADQADLFEAIAGFDYLSISSKQQKPPAAAQVGIARFAASRGWLDQQRIRSLFESAIAGGDIFASFAYAEWLLSTQRSAIEPVALRDRLRRPARAGLPEAQILLGLLCEARSDARCERDEARQLKTSAETAYGRAEVEWQRFVALAQGDLQIADAKKATQSLAAAADAGSGPAMDVLASRASEDAGSGARSREAERWEQRAVAAGHPRAIYLQGRREFEAATGRSASATAIAQLRHAVDLGVSDAAVVLGNAYRDGKAVEKNPSETLRLYRLGAEWGNAIAQHNYAFVLARGEGVAADPVGARRWFMRSLLQGYANAGGGLGDLYRQGRGTAKNAALAARYFRWGAELGCVTCEDVLGDMLWEGEGLSADHAEAVRWYAKAAAQGNFGAERSLARAYQSGDAVEQSWPRAIAGYRHCADAGYVLCQADLGWVLMHGPKELRDATAAVEWLRKAADRDNAVAANTLGWAYEWGEGVGKDEVAAFAFYRRCETYDEADAAECLNNLGRAYMYGIGTTADASNAVKLYRRAKDLGSVSASCNLGEALLGGVGIEQDRAQALALFKEAAEKDNPRCQWLYGSMLTQGPREGHTEALAMLRKALQNGEHGAEPDIARLLLFDRSGVRDEPRGIEFASQCFDSGNAACGTALGIYYRWWKQPPDNASSKAWLIKAEAAGDADAAYNLGSEAYFGADGRSPDAAVARPHLVIAAKSNDFAAIWLAHIDQAEGKVDDARARLLERSHDHLLVRLFLVGLCAPPNHCDGIPTRADYLVELDKVRDNKNLLNLLVWKVATDPLVTREDGALAVAITDRYATTFRDDWGRMDTRAAALARAGRSAEACTLQRRVIAAAAKAKAANQPALGERRDAYCRGEAWNGD